MKGKEPETLYVLAMIGLATIGAATIAAVIFVIRLVIIVTTV